MVKFVQLHHQNKSSCVTVNTDSGLFRNIKVGVRQIAHAGKVRRAIKISKVSCSKFFFNPHEKRTIYLPEYIV